MRLCVWLLLCALSLATAPAATPLSGGPCTCDGATLRCIHLGKAHLYSHEICPNATTAFLNLNRFSDYPESIVSFVELDMSSNRLTVLPRASQLNPSIKYLELSGNLIRNVTRELQSLGRLEILKLEDNQLTSLSFLPDPCELRELHFRRNTISSLEGPLRGCIKLMLLDLETNALQVLPAGVFADMVELRILHLAGNPLGTLASDTFRGPVQLQRLFLRGMNLNVLPDHVFPGLPRLEMLYLGDNKLRTFDASQLDGLNALKELQIWGNRLTEVPVLKNCCAVLEDVRFDLNYIRSVSEAAVRSYLQNKRARLLLDSNPLHAASLHWTLGATDLLPYASEYRCLCGGLRFDAARVQWCVLTDSYRYNEYVTIAPCESDWVTAVRTVAEANSEISDSAK